MEENRSYFAVLPANVRYDRRLKLLSRILYAEITALCNEKGFCWARNKYFADLYGVSTKTISTCIGQLKECGYVDIDMIYKEGSKEIVNRYLRICNEGIEKIFHTPMEENVKENNININNTSNKKTKGTSEKLEEKLPEIIKNLNLDEEYVELTKSWLKYKRDIKEGYKSEFSLIAFVKRLAEFSNNQPELARKVLEQSFERNWKTVYKLQDDSFKSKPVTSNEINYKCDFIQEDGTYYNPYL
jgi:hypothetical protein